MAETTTAPTALAPADRLREAAEPPPDWAASRDASWYERPNVRSDKSVHMAGRMARRGEGFMSKCGRSVLDEDSAWTPADVPEGLRCQSNGCRQAWPTTPAVSR